MSYAKLTEARLDAVASAACRLCEGLTLREDESEWKREKKGRSDRRWVSQKTGAVKYSDTNPGAARKGRDAGAGGQTPPSRAQTKPRSKPAAAAEPKPTEDSLKARLSAVLSGKDLPADAAALAGEFMALTKPQLRKIMDGVAKKIGKDKAAMARNLADAALEYGRRAEHLSGRVELSDLPGVADEEGPLARPPAVAAPRVGVEDGREVMNALRDNFGTMSVEDLRSAMDDAGILPGGEFDSAVLKLIDDGVLVGHADADHSRFDDPASQTIKTGNRAEDFLASVSVADGPRKRMSPRDRVPADLAAQYGGSDEAMAWLNGLSDDDLAGLGFGGGGDGGEEGLVFPDDDADDERLIFPEDDEHEEELRRNRAARRAQSKMADVQKAIEGGDTAGAERLLRGVLSDLQELGGDGAPAPAAPKFGDEDWDALQRHMDAAEADMEREGYEFGTGKSGRPPRRRPRPEPPISLSGAMDDAPDEDEAPFTRRPPKKSERAGDSPAEREARIRKYRERAGRSQDIFGESRVRGLGPGGALTPAQRARLLEAWTRGERRADGKFKWTSDVKGERPRWQISEPGSRGKKKAQARGGPAAAGKAAARGAAGDAAGGRGNAARSRAAARGAGKATPVSQAEVVDAAHSLFGQVNRRLRSYTSEADIRRDLAPIAKLPKPVLAELLRRNSFPAGGGRKRMADRLINALIDTWYILEQSRRS